MSCPDDTELAGFLNDSLTGERLSHLSEHVDGCPHCQARLDRLTEQTDGAVARYKDLSSGVLQDSRSGLVGAPGDDTQILGGKPIKASAFVGLPRVPGFDVAAEIGRGGMGVVYKARHRKLNRLVALKMVLAGSAADPRIVQRFLIEAEVLARIQHPQVVQVFEVDMYQGPSGVPIPYLAMELLEGGSLSRKLRENNAGSGPRWPGTRAAAELVEGLARAVHAAHLRGVIHRDLKPGNILFAKDEGGRMKDEEKKEEKVGTVSSFILHPSSLPKVMDFGLAKFTHDSGADLTQSGQVVGTPQYMAPEQAAGNRDIGPTADVYALGAILFECLAGRPPFTGSEPMSVLLKVVNESPPDVRTLRPEVPRDLAAVTMKCLEKEPGRRYASAEALADDLRRFLDDRPTRARPVTNLERLRLWGRRNPAVAGLIAALAVVLVTAFVTVASLWVEAERNAEQERNAKKAAELSQGRAEREAQNAAASLLEVQKQKALLEFGRAVQSCEEGRAAEGLTLFLSAAEIAEQTGQADLARVARVNLAAWPRELPPARSLSLAHKEQPRLAVFHPDGEHVLTVGRAGELYLWRLADGKKVRAYDPVPHILGPIWSSQLTYWTLALSPDGKTIAAGGSDRSITVWDIGSSEPRVSFEAVGPKANIWSLGFSSNDTLWANDGEGGLKRWDLTAKPKPKATPFAPRTFGDTLQILAVSPDGARVYSGDRSGKVREWDAATGAERYMWQINGWVTDVAVSADGARLAATGPDGLVSVMNLQTREVYLRLTLAGAYGNGVAFAPKSPILVSTDGDGNVRFWHRETGQPIGLPMRLPGEVTRPRFRADADMFAVPAGDSVHVSGVPVPPGELLFTGRLRTRGLSYAPGGDRLAAADESTVTLLDPVKGGVLQPPARVGASPLSLCFDGDPARSFVYRGTREGFDRLAVPGSRKAEELKSSAWLGRVFRVECLPGAAGLYVMGQQVVARYDPATLKVHAARRAADDIPAGTDLDTMAVRPDGKEVLAAFLHRVVFLNGETLEPLREWAVGGSLLDARYTPDGKKVLVGRRDNVAELLDAASGAPVLSRGLTHTRGVAAVAVSPDGAVLLTGSRDFTARFWDATTGLPLGPPLRHSGPVTHVAFSPKGDRVATGTGDNVGHVMVWGVPPPPLKESIAELKAKME
jgi:serine/threonine protein kinase/WD40 repeat protein